MTKVQSPRRSQDVKYNEVTDSRTGVTLVLTGARVQFAATPLGVFDATGVKLSDDLEEFKEALGVKTLERHARDFQRSIDWFVRTFPQLIPAERLFSPRQFVEEHRLEKPDSFSVTSAEEAKVRREAILAAIPLAKEAGADVRFLTSLGRWARGWRSIEHRYSQGPSGPRDAKTKPPPAAVLARKSAKRERDRAMRTKMRGRKTG